MKFGGTSVEDPAAISRTAAIVAGRVALGKQPVVVVSAHGQSHRPAAARCRRSRLRRPHRRARHQLAAALAPSRHRLRAGRKMRPTLDHLHRPEIRLARRDSARPRRHPRAHAAHLRPRRQLRRAHLQPHRRRRFQRARHRRRSRRCARRHHHRLALPESRPAGCPHRKRAARNGCVRSSSRARSR